LTGLTEQPSRPSPRAPGCAGAGPSPELVSFPSGDSTLRGYVHGPEGAGPFPAIIWNHGSERLPGSCADLGSFYTSAGYVFFVPHRHGHGQSPGKYPLGTVPTRARAQTEDTAGYRRKGIELLIELHEAYLEDTVAAVKWLKRQPFVDSTRMAMSGVSHGGIQTVLAAEADAGMKAYVPFAPAAIAWRGNPELQDRLLCAVQTAHAPMFLLQAENDYSLGPSEILGGELKRKGAPNGARVYPPHGQTQDSGHGAFACQGTRVWGADVCAFLDAVLKPSAAAA
jgi:carboxymethylenebutenolidase